MHLVFARWQESVLCAGEDDPIYLDQVKEINTGKKDAPTRFRELRSYALKPVVDFCVDNLEMMSRDSFMNGVIVEALVIDQEQEVLVPLIDKILASLREADPENAGRLANFVRRLAKRAEKPLACKLAGAMVTNLKLWINIHRCSGCPLQSRQFHRRCQGIGKEACKNRVQLVRHRSTFTINTHMQHGYKC